MIALCERAQRTLTDETATFGEFRRREVDAAASLADIRTAIEATRARLEPTRARLETLADTYHPARSLGIASNVDAAATLLDDASRTAEAVAPRISAAGVSNIAEELQEARQHVHRAQQQLDAVDRTAADLATATDALATLVRDTQRDLADAKVQRDAAPDAETGDAIIRAIASVEAALVAGEHTKDPIAELDRVGNAVAELDLALASARNQQQRLEHARAALVGTLVSAKSQIAEVRGYIGGRGGGVDARTRLAEAERQLMLAQAETDPVEALDTARRAVTHARDADALARYRDGGLDRRPAATQHHHQHGHHDREPGERDQQRQPDRRAVRGDAATGIHHDPLLRARAPGDRGTVQFAVVLGDGAGERDRDRDVRGCHHRGRRRPRRRPG